MYIAIKEKDNVYIGTSILDNNIDSDESDMVLEDNVPLFRVKGQKNTYVCVEETSFSADLLRYDKKIFNVELNDKNVFNVIVPKMRKFLSEHELIDKEGRWDNRLIITNGDLLYEISNDFTVTKEERYLEGNSWKRLIQGSLIETEGLSPQERIYKGYETVYKMRGAKLFPYVLLDVKSGKKSIIRK